MKLTKTSVGSRTRIVRRNHRSRVPISYLPWRRGSIYHPAHELQNPYPFTCTSHRHLRRGLPSSRSQDGKSETAAPPQGARRIAVTACVCDAKEGSNDHTSLEPTRPGENDTHRTPPVGQRQRSSRASWSHALRSSGQWLVWNTTKRVENCGFVQYLRTVPTLSAVRARGRPGAHR